VEPTPSARGVCAIALQLTGLGLCPLALAYGFADNGPVEWALLTLAAIVFFAGWSLSQGRRPEA
jgi:predicted acyltransferase